MVEDSPIVAALKRYALEQAAPPPPAPTASPVQAALSGMSAPMPNIQSPAPQVSLAGPQQMASNVPSIAAPQAPQVNPVQSQPGPIKSFLQQFVHGAGQGLLTHVGLENDAQRNQRVFNQQLATQNAARQGQLTDAQIASLQNKSENLDAQNAPVDLSTYGIPGLAGTVPQKNVATVIAQHVKNQGSAKVAGIRADASRDVADTRADASTANAQIAAQVRRDIGSGNIAMAGARLRLAQAKANGELAGNTPSAQRLNKADLANNAQHNLNNAIDIISTSPDLFGKVAGHFTTAEQLIGSDDPRIQKLGNELHAAAQASGGVHGLRSAEAVKDTERMWLNQFRGSPEATAAGLKATADSLNDYINFANYGKQAAPRIGNSPTAPTAPTAVPASHPFFQQFGGVPVKP